MDEEDEEGKAKIPATAQEIDTDISPRMHEHIHHSQDSTKAKSSELRDL